MKISIIGAGSAQFSLGLIRDICLSPELEGAFIYLMDIDEFRLDIVYKLANKYASELGVNVYFQKTTDRIDAYYGADFVINTALAGGHQHMENERALLEKYGYYRGIGVHASHLQLDLMKEIAHDVKTYCPDAWLIQSANPLVEGCTLMHRETGVKIVGLCHGYFEYHKMVEVLDLAKEDVEIEAIGFNHSIWMTKFKYRGKDAYYLLDEWIKEGSEQYWRDWDADHADLQMSRASIDMYKRYGLMPIGDTCRGSTPEHWWYHLDLQEKIKWWGELGGFDSEIGWQDHLEWLNNCTQSLQNASVDEDISILDVFPPEKSLEQIVPVILALAGYSPDRSVFQVNIPNNGMFDYLPDDIFVEGPATISKDKIQFAAVTELPNILKYGVMLPRYLYAERLVSAYLEKDIRFLAQAYLSDHKTKTSEQADNALTALVSMVGNETMRKHYMM